MAYTYDELKHKTVAELREIAHGIEHEALQGYTQLNKEHLLARLCQALGIDTHVHHHHEVVGIDKAQVKAQLHALKRQRDGALASHDHAQLKTVRREMHRLKRQIRRATT